ncbi:mitochondrial 54S ribosomal protein bL35m [Magnusiomyces paraingens]|uniref:50S ribosomal protein L35 n=1 Tax=Magnusiomyces paraingens TaxID=2606893 RepID=A0A5E8B7E4_9ASCO|nr:uncharacterized protein SAPINGB_P001731 [Saprochaete ingens]VVT47478.1 unnamed protein product [Saprochaete ingens]
MLNLFTRPKASIFRATLTSPSSLLTPIATPFIHQSPNVISSRTLLKTHKGAAKRWKKTGNGGFKRGKAGHNHGNVDWSRSVVNNVSGTAYAKGSGYGNHLKKLNRLLPNA